ncbi:hypothetical protein C8T65DRAFT_746230 [Cerioporus squamosus]|nr:hypothetical protein C8T65DRAFT_746230 [Cerioporus squamosus]
MLEGSPLKCNHFRWKDTIPRGKPPEGVPSKLCKGYVCTHGRGSRKINAECKFGLCQQCCVHLHVTIVGTPSCGCNKHDNAFEEGPRYSLPDHAVLPTITYPPHWQPPSPSSTPANTQTEPYDSDDAPSPPRARRAAASSTRAARGGQRGAAATTTGTRAGASATAAGAAQPPAGEACLGSNHRSSYAISFSPVYDYTLYQAQMIEQQRLDRAAMSKQVGHAQMRITDLFWWDENGKPARQIRVEVPNDPWFHPRDSAHLVNRFGLKDGTLFQFYDWRKDSWLDAGFDSVPLHVDVSGELHYRSHGVTWSSDMPGSSMPFPVAASACQPTGVSAMTAPSTPSSHALGKRAMPGPVIDLTDEEDDESSSITPTAPSLPSFLLHRSNPMSTPSTTRGSPTPSSRFSTPSSVASWSTPSQHADFSYGSPSLDADWASLGIEDVPVVQVAGSSSSSAVAPSRSASSSNLTLSDAGLDLDPAPRGPSSTGWPWLYASDMIAGFKAMEALRRTGLTIPAAFAHAFRGSDYVRGTFNENQAVYNAARQVPGELQRWRELGRQDSGKWSEFRKKWGRKRS